MRERGGETRAVVLDNDTTGMRIRHEVIANVVKGSVLCTDEHQAYNFVNARYTHMSVTHSAKHYVEGMAHTNGIESVWAVLKRGYHGIYHHFTVKHMQRYVDEFSFRLNDGNCKVHTMDRIDALTDRRTAFASLQGADRGMNEKADNVLFERMVARFELSAKVEAEEEAQGEGREEEIQQVVGFLLHAERKKKKLSSIVDFIAGVIGLAAAIWVGLKAENDRPKIEAANSGTDPAKQNDNETARCPARPCPSNQEYASTNWCDYLKDQKTKSL